ncbi:MULTISPECIES: hypothetical protein [unclassified Acinetobacter]|uniref:hypothetical protein n=1 Tax=unclassified Acinetobacter TaxID=196816 RepID=UPI0035BB6492
MASENNRHLRIMAVVFIGVFIFIFSKYMRHASEEKTQEKVLSYLKGDKIKNDFATSPEIGQDILVSFPKITIYVDDKYREDINVSDDEKQYFDERKCDFVYDLFRAMHANDRGKPQILQVLKDENVEVDYIYRNKYAQTRYQTHAVIKDCKGWYDKKANS